MFRFSNLEQDCFGGVQEVINTSNYADKVVDHTKNAYMLIYEKRRKEPLKIKVTDNLLPVH